MPSASNVVVKKNDGVTDITYTTVQPSSGDGVAAIWQSQTVGNSISHRPEFRLSAREADQGRKRAARVTFMYPQIATNSTTTLTSVVDRTMISANVTLPKAMAVADINEAVSQFANLLASTLIKDCLKQGYSAT